MGDQPLAPAALRRVDDGHSDARRGACRHQERTPIDRQAQVDPQIPQLGRGETLRTARPAVIKKYPNRRLYDTVESRYITLADVRRLVSSASTSS